MTLDDLLSGVTVSKRVQKDPWQSSKTPALDIGAVRFDSRQVGPRDVYVAVRGTVSDGHRFIEEAIRRGAEAVVLEDDDAVSDAFFGHEGVAKIVVPSSRKALADIACNFYRHPSRRLRLIGVTGTNGKTTTVRLIRAVLEAAGERVGMIGTVGHFDGQNEIPATHTTPESTELNRLLAGMADGGCASAVMEVSSHALSLERVRGLKFRTGVFTNLTQDHLDFHGSMEEYFRAKEMLFRMLDRDAVAVSNLDDASGRRMIERTEARTVTYGRAPMSDVFGETESCDVNGIRLSVSFKGNRVSLESSLVGAFNVSNILAASAVCFGIGVDPSMIQKGIASVSSVRGRFESVRSDKGWTAVIDYAHTPDALQNVIRAARSLRGAKGRLITVFGCGGDRDRGKRHLMGAIASKESDVTIITSDNPRSEDPAEIIAEIMRGVEARRNIHEEPDRAKAIRLGLEMAGTGDVVLIAGKGHETYQVLGGRTVHFDDREEVRKFLSGS